ncbi:dual 3',5'-cyclic-AMP and -GMP phosphodiesterase 11-like [Diaphorina citri]|uniref:Phosphodiesterase n=1 Tax=Diaphorina citri TaxID=121845 RepID=A0A3Q0JGV9_DIACI|nr:dual 3',5'-cyclic-AMP and -GMP phosphodiesterase 11-like [Diaphorina citri]
MIVCSQVKDICNELDVRSLCHKILQNVSTLLNADRGSLFLVQGDVRCTSSSSPSSPSQISLKVPPPSRPVGCLSSMHHAPPPPAPPPPASVAASSLVVGVPRPETFCTSSTHIQAHSAQGCHSKCLVSKLFDVCSRSTLQEMEKKEEIRIPWGCGIVGYVAESGEPVNIPDAYLVSTPQIRIPWGCGIVGYVAESGEPVNIPDAYLVSTPQIRIPWGCGIVGYVAESGEPVNIPDAYLVSTPQIRIPWGCGIVGYVAESGEPVNIPDAYLVSTPQIRIPWGCGIVGYVAESGEPVNIPDAYLVSTPQIRIPWGCGIVGYVAESGEPVNIPDAYLVSTPQIRIPWGCGIVGYVAESGEPVNIPDAYLVSTPQIRIPWGCGIVGYVAESGEPVNIPDAYLAHSAQGCHSKCLVSKLFDVCSRSTLQEMEKKEEIRIPWGCGIVGYVAESGEPVNIPDAYLDNRFNQEIDARTGYKTRTLLCMPIKDFNGDVIGVAQVINKHNDGCFTSNDEKVFASYLQFCGIGLRNAQLYEKSQLEVKRNQVLLDLARMIFEEQSTIEHMVFRILTHTQSLIQCQRVQSLRVPSAAKLNLHDFKFDDIHMEDDDTLKIRIPWGCGIVGYVAESGEPVNTSQSSLVPRPETFCTSSTHIQSGEPVNIPDAYLVSTPEIRIPWGCGIVGYVAESGEPVNIPDAYLVSTPQIRIPWGCGIVCYLAESGEPVNIPDAYLCRMCVFGFQLINKFDDLAFSKNDENFVEAFAIFCGMGIHNTHMYEKAVIAMAKQSVTLDVLSYHASASLEDAQRLRSLRVPSAAKLNLHDFKFDDIHMEDDDTLKVAELVSSEFFEQGDIERQELNITPIDIMNREKEDQLPLMQVGFIDSICLPIYEFQSTQWWKIFGEIECLALLIACLCHDLDHRGTNNSFQINYLHFDQCLMILNSAGNQILSNVSPDEYSRIIKVLEEAILSTDLAVYFRQRGSFLSLVKGGSLAWHREADRGLLRGMTMTVCDLAAITKPWHVEKRVSNTILQRVVGMTMTVCDLAAITKPWHVEKRAFAELSDKLEPLVEGVRSNKQHWLEIAAEKRKQDERERCAECVDMLQAFAELSDKLEPLVEGVRSNKQHWLEIAAEKRKQDERERCAES